MKEEILKVMKEAGRPMSAGEVEKLLKADRKEIDKAFKALKEEGKSFLRCVANGNRRNSFRTMLLHVSAVCVIHEPLNLYY